MERIGLYKQLTPFTNENAGTAEWCMAEKDGIQYFVKKFQSPVYPSKDLGLPEKKYQSRVVKFHAAEESRKAMYRALRENDTSGTLVVPVEVINYQYHICTIAEYIVGNVSSNEIFRLSEWQRLVLMRTLTLALINVHRAGVVHSDMKPDNVLITQNPENGSCALKLIDFDGSFMASNPPEDVTGDPAYFAPEAYAMATMPGIRLDKRIDVFALGIIFHYFWTGKLPEKSADQTIGQCILKGETVKLDSSIPEQLRTIIKQSLEGNPDKRISEEQIYNGLEKILTSYPVKIINLQEGRKKKPAPTGTRRTSATRETETTKSMSVPVMHCDKEGRTLRSHAIEIAYGGRGAAYAEKIPGYHVISSRERIEVSVDKDGNASEYPIRFIYEKEKQKNGFAKFFGWVAAIGVVYLIIVYAASFFSFNIGNYRRAAEFMRYAPLFDQVFPSQYHRTIEELSSPVTISHTKTDYSTWMTADIVLPTQYSYFKFTPSDTGWYSLTSFSDKDTQVFLYDSRRQNILASDDDGGGNRQFYLKYYMQKNTTYYWGVHYYNDKDTGNFSVMLTKSGEDINVGQAQNVTISQKDGRVIYTFVPENSNYYTFYSTGTNDTFAELYDMYWNQLEYNDDINSSQGNYNFGIRYYLDAGVRYYYVAKFLSQEQTGTFNIHLQ